MDMMRENDEGKMEFPRDVMLEDCFSGSDIPLYGFVSNVTIPEEMLEPCLLGIECFENGTRIDDGNNSTRGTNLDINTDTISSKRIFTSCIHTSFILKAAATGNIIRCLTSSRYIRCRQLKMIV